MVNTSDSSSSSSNWINPKAALEPAPNTTIPDDHGGQSSINNAVRDIGNACAAAAANTTNSSSSTFTRDQDNNTACSSHASISTLPFSKNTNNKETKEFSGTRITKKPRATKALCYWLLNLVYLLIERAIASVHGAVCSGPLGSGVSVPRALDECRKVL